MYDELVKQCRDCIDCLCGECKYEHLQKPGNFVPCMNALLGEAADAIEELSKPRWIPVTEQLPKKECGIYWICTDSGYQCECRWTNNKYGLGESDNWGWHIMDKPQYQKVIAWRKLPEPYEPTKEE